MQIAALKDEGVCRLVGFSFFSLFLPIEGLEGVLLIDGGCIERGGGRGAGKEESVVEPLHPSSSNTTHH